MIDQTTYHDGTMEEYQYATLQAARVHMDAFDDADREDFATITIEAYDHESKEFSTICCWESQPVVPAQENADSQPAPLFVETMFSVVVEFKDCGYISIVDTTDADHARAVYDRHIEVCRANSGVSRLVLERYDHNFNNLSIIAQTNFIGAIHA